MADGEVGMGLGYDGDIGREGPRPAGDRCNLPLGVQLRIVGSHYLKVLSEGSEALGKSYIIRQELPHVHKLQ